MNPTEMKALLSIAMLAAFADQQKQYLPQIQQKANTIDPSQVMSLVRGP